MPKIQPQFLQNFLNQNPTHIQEAVKRVLEAKTSQQKILFAFDFDECATYEHLSKQVTKAFWHRAEISDQDFQDHGLTGVARLFDCYVGLSKQEFIGKITELAHAITWRKDFLEFNQFLSKNPTIFPVIISSGLRDAAEIAMQHQGITNVQIIADELVYDQTGILLGPSLIVGDQEKGELVQALKQGGGFETTFTVGHNGSDLALIAAGSTGYRFALRDDPRAIEVADHVFDSWLELRPFLDKVA